MTETAERYSETGDTERLLFSLLPPAPADLASGEGVYRNSGMSGSTLATRESRPVNVRCLRRPR